MKLIVSADKKLGKARVLPSPSSSESDFKVEIARLNRINARHVLDTDGHFNNQVASDARQAQLEADNTELRSANKVLEARVAKQDAKLAERDVELAERDAKIAGMRDFYREGMNKFVTPVSEKEKGKEKVVPIELDEEEGEKNVVKAVQGEEEGDPILRPQRSSTPIEISDDESQTTKTSSKSPTNSTEDTDESDDEFTVLPPKPMIRSRRHQPPRIIPSSTEAGPSRRRSRNETEAVQRHTGSVEERKRNSKAFIPSQFGNVASQEEKRDAEDDAEKDAEKAAKKRKLGKGKKKTP